MNLVQIESDLKSPAIQILRSPNASLFLSFLYRQFKNPPRPNIPETELIEQLDYYLDQLREQDASIYPKSATHYVRDWCDAEHGWLRRYRPGSSDDYIVELTVQTERALGWLAELQQRNFIGTESRFYQITQLLEDMVVKSNQDVEMRIRQIENEIAAKQTELEHIRQTGQVNVYTPMQVRERFQLLDTMVNQLLRDFGEVEEHFREVARSVQEAQLRPEARKGTVVGQVLEEDASLRESEVGRSFYGFWDYLQIPTQRDTLNQHLEILFELPEISTDMRQNSHLRNMTYYLTQAGLKVDKSNQRLAEQLRRMLDEASLAEARRVRQLIAEIKHMSFQLDNLFDDKEPFIELESMIDAQLVMERELWEPIARTLFEELPNETAVINLAEVDLSTLLNQFYVDRSRLQQHIDASLDEVSQVSLAELVEVFPIMQGLPEIVTYLDLASQADYHQIDYAEQDTFVITSTQHNNQVFQITMPRIYFRKYAHELSTD